MSTYETEDTIAEPIPVQDVKYLSRSVTVLARLIRIIDLPPCSYRELWIAVVNKPEEALVWVVGRPGDSIVGDWAAYIGHPLPSALKRDPLLLSNPRLIYPKGVMDYGDKLMAAAARRIFPEFNHLKYRP